MDDLAVIKGITGLGVAIYTIKLMAGIITSQMNKKPNETELKESSREKIADTNTVVKEIRNSQKARDLAFYEMKNENHDIHDVVTAKNENGIPIVYQTKLDLAINDLSNSIKILAEKSGG